VTSQTSIPRGRFAADVTRLGVPRGLSRDLYHGILEQSWSGFYGILIALYLLANCVFATLYWLLPGAIAESDNGWGDSFFFSIETMATVGYGVMHPQTLAAHILVVVEILFGVLAVPVATGLTIVKFARPTARVLFSRRVVCAPFDGTPHLMFRVANARNKGIVEARVKMTLLREIRTREGISIRRLIDLPLLRENNPIFALSWTLLHPIDEKSPLHGLAPEEWLTKDLVIICVLTGIDETSSANVHARYNYFAEDIFVDHRFHDIIKVAPDGGITLDLRMFHDIEAIEQSLDEVTTSLETMPVET